MKKLVLLTAMIFAVGMTFGLGSASAQVNNLNEPGSILVFPLIDNINYSSIIEIANTNPTTPVWLAGYIVAHPAGEPENFTKSDFKIFLTPKEVFWWDTGTAIPARGLQSFDNRKGFMFVWAISGAGTALEIPFNFLKGDSLMFGGNGRAMMYNAIPHQGLAVIGDRVLNLDGIEYTMATSQILAEGFSAGFSGIQGTLAVCSLNIDFIDSIQPAFDINVTAWNEVELSKSVHLEFYQFVQYDVALDLELALNQVFTPKWHLATSSTDALWAVLFQTTGGLMWGTNVFQNPAFGVPAVVVLPPVTN
jgi:hypothetical protein